MINSANSIQACLLPSMLIGSLPQRFFLLEILLGVTLNVLSANSRPRLKLLTKIYFSNYCVYD